MTEHLNAGGGGATHLGRYDFHASCWKPACGATARAWFRVDFKGIPSLGSVVDRIRAILDRPAPAERKADHG